MLPFAVGRETREGGTRTRESAVKGKSFVIYTHAMYVRKGERTTEHSYGIRRREGDSLLSLSTSARAVAAYLTRFLNPACDVRLSGGKK